LRVEVGEFDQLGAMRVAAEIAYSASHAHAYSARLAQVGKDDRRAAVGAALIPLL
jgi:hypothetical protein